MFLSNKTNIKTDGVGDLYRSADKIAKGDIERGIWFFEMAKDKVGELIKIEVDREKVENNRLYWAEIIHDEYMRLKWIV